MQGEVRHARGGRKGPHRKTPREVEKEQDPGWGLQLRWSVGPEDPSGRVTPAPLVGLGVLEPLICLAAGERDLGAAWR